MVDNPNDNTHPPLHHEDVPFATILREYEAVSKSIIRLHAIQDPEDQSTVTPFFSRAGAWAYQVDWYSTEDVNGCYQDMFRHGENTGNNVLFDIISRIQRPLFRVLVARNARLVKKSGSDIRLDPSLEALMTVPDSIADIGSLMKTKSRSHIASHWMVTHLFTILQDRLHSALYQSLFTKIPLYPQRIPETDALSSCSRTPHLSLGVEPSKLKKDDPLRKALEWMEVTQRDWFQVTQSFIRGYMEFRRLTRAKEDVRRINQGLMEPHTPLRDLFFHTTHLDALGNVGVPLLNLHEAALALASMQLYDGKGGDTRWHALLQSNTGLTLQDTYANASFLRPIFAATVLGPVALLSNRSLRPSNNCGLTLTQFTQISMLPSQDVSFERMIIGKDLWLLLLNMAVKGPSVVFDQLDLLIPAWCSLLHLDSSGDFHEDIYPRILPPQRPDPLFPVTSPSHAQADTDDDDVRVIQSFRLLSAHPQGEEQTGHAKARAEITNLMNKSYSTNNVHEYVKQVDEQLRTTVAIRPTTQVQLSSLRDIPCQANDGNRTPPQRVDSTEESLHVIKPPTEKIRSDFQLGMFVTQDGRRQYVDVLPPFPPTVLDLPKWVPQDHDTRLHSHVQYLDAFTPEVSPSDEKEILFSDEKIRLTFAWPVAKTQDMASLATMVASAQKRFLTSSYTAKGDEAVAVRSHMAWHGFSKEKRGRLFKTSSIHLRHSGHGLHPFPVCPEISEWDDGQLSAYFDIYACVEAEDQTWVPRSHYEEDRSMPVADYAMNIPRRNLERQLSRLDKHLPPLRQPSEYPDVVDWVDTFPSVVRPVDPNLDATSRHLDEEDSDIRDRCSSIDQFLYSLRRGEELKTKVNGAFAGVLLIRHVPLHVRLPLYGLDSFGHLASRDSYAYNHTRPTNSATFAQFLSPTATIRTHVAPNGCATHMRLVLGQVAVFVAIPDCEDAELFCTDTSKEEAFARRVHQSDIGESEWRTEVREHNGRSYRPIFSVLHGFQEASLSWQLILLRPGDDLFLRPNTIHFMFATKASLLVHGLFYSAPNLDRTLVAMTIQHYYGHLSVRDNALSVRCSALSGLFIKMVSYHKQALQSRHGDIRPTGNTILNDKELAFLLCILGHLSQLDPSIGMEDKDFDKGEDDQDGWHDIRRLPRPRTTQP